MKIERTRASRNCAHPARRYNVSPVTRAIRSVLTVSAAALAFSGTGVALAKTPSAPAALAAQRATLAQQAAIQIPSTVVDLTVVHDASLPTSVVDGGFDLHAALADPDLQLAANTGPGDGGHIDNVLDLTAVPMLAPGPGDGTTPAGTTNDVAWSVSQPGSGPHGWTLNPGFSYSAYSPDGYAVGAFATADSMTIRSYWDIDVVGYTWASGIEVESLAGNTIIEHHGTTTVTETGDTGTAVGLYGFATGNTTITNTGDVSANAFGVDGIAIGMFGYAVSGDANVSNQGNVNVTAAPGYGTAIGAVAASVSGDATVANAATTFVDGPYATGLLANAMAGGDARTDNTDALVVTGAFTAYGMHAISADGTASANNDGDITASAYYFGVGIMAEGVDAVVTNSGTVSASGTVGEANGIFAIGDTARVTNSGDISADSAYGTAYGVYAVGYDSSTVDNQLAHAISATSFTGDAFGVLAYGATVDVDNAGSISAKASGGYSQATGVLALGGDIALTNTRDGSINASGHYATGIDVRGAGNVSVDNSGDVDANGTFATAIIVRSSGEGAHAFVSNDDDVTATGDVFASGIEAISRAFKGTATVWNGGTVDVASTYGDVQGIVAAADLDANVTNFGWVYADGGSSAYGVLALSADGHVNVENMGTIEATTSGRGGVAYGIAAQSNTGLVTVTNDNTIHALGDSATGIYASAKWNDVQLENNGDMLVIGYADAGTGIQGISYTGDVAITNNRTLGVGGAYSAVGLWSISIYGDANVVNNGDVQTGAGVLDRALFARALDGGDANITNTNSVSSNSAYSSYGAWARAEAGHAHVTNSGTIDSEAGYGNAYGLVAGGWTGSDVTVSDTGMIHAFGGYAGGGILAYSNGGDTSVTNAGDIVAGSYVTAIGVQALAYNAATIVNDGQVQAYSLYGGAIGLLANGYSVDIGGMGAVSAIAYGNAIGIEGDGENVSILLTDGTVDASAYFGSAYGVIANAGDVASLRNNADITATSTYGDAIGELALGGATAITTNGGDMIVTALEGNATGALGQAADVDMTNDGTMTITGGVSAAGMVGFGDNHAILINHGDISATATDGVAFGLYAYAEGYARANNNGGIVAHAGNGAAYGIYVVGDTAIVRNSATSTIDASVDNGLAMGVYAWGATSTTIDNAGTVTATAAGGNAIGLFAIGYTAVDVTNTGAVSASVTGAHQAIALRAQGAFDDATVTVDNTAALTATGGGKYSMAAGIIAAADGDVTVTNGSAITATNAMAAYGIVASSVHGTATVTNGGDITATGMQFPHGIGIGIYANSEYGDVQVDNTGHITAAGKYAFGIQAVAAGDASVTNGNAIAVTSDIAHAVGVYASGDTAHVVNLSDITVSGGLTAVGIGIDADSAATVTHDGTITVVQTGASSNPAPLTVDPGNAIGIAGYAVGSLSIGGTGSIDVTSVYGNAIGIQAFSQGIVSVAHDGDITAFGPESAEGIFALGTAVDVQNTGTITADSVFWAAGIDARGDTVTIGNDGTIHASVNDVAADVAGLYGYGATSLAIDNGGDIVTTATTGTAFGILAHSGVGTVSVTNGHSIDASGLGDAIGIEANANGAVAIDNGGDVFAHANDYAIGILGVGDSVAIGNADTVDAHVTGFLGHAYAVVAEGDAVSFDNTAHLRATAEGGQGMAVGARLSGYSSLDVQNHGDILATAIGPDDFALGLFAIGGDGASVANFATVEADAGYGPAMGALVYAKYGTANVANGGTISATAVGGPAIGLRVQSGGDIALDNGGTIEATSADYVFALMLDGPGLSTVHNTGTIAAHSNLEESIAIWGGIGEQHITNAGDILGAMVLGYGDDVVTNASGGNWVVLGHITDFGAGDDTIVNAAGGTILMNDASISLGSSSGVGNAFTNAGVLAVNGDSHIDMGTGVVTLAGNAPIDVLNPAAFTNDGTISFLDGAPDDILTITGDFAGHGALNVDVSLLNGTSDVLYVEGNIVDGTRQALNVRVLDMAAAGTNVSIPVVVVTGESEPGQFVAGTFTVDNVLFSASNFLDLKVAITERINASNSAVDLFSLTLGFDGINDTGAIAAAIAPGAHSLMGAQVGTFRQRMGVFTQLGNGDKGAWVRVFRDKGTIDPSSRMDNLPQGGNFAFDQTNSGVETGFNALVTDGVFVGASLAKSKGKQSLAHDGLGSDEIDGDTVGAYLTWLSPTGFYADLSYRWMHFDAELVSAGGRREIGGDAGALNLEAGWNLWTSAGGLKVVPQAQYTRTKVENIDHIQGDLADFVSDGGTSSRVRAGVEFQQTFKTDKGNWTPYGTISAIREFDGESRFTIADTFTGRTSTEGTSAMVEFGANVDIGRVNLFGGVNWTDGGAVDSVFGGQVGLRYTW